MADAVVPSFTPCQFEIAWVGKCGKPTTNGWCTVHEAKMCVSCGGKATQTCDYTGMNPLVCGAPLCNSCKHEPYHSVSVLFPNKHLTRDAHLKAVEESLKAEPVD